MRNTARRNARPERRINALGFVGCGIGAPTITVCRNVNWAAPLSHRNVITSIETPIASPDGRNDGNWTSNAKVSPADPAASLAAPKLPAAAKGPGVAANSSMPLNERNAVQGPGALGSLPVIDRCRPSVEAILASRWFSAMKPSRNDRQAPPTNPAISSNVASDGAMKRTPNSPVTSVDTH